MNIVRGIFLLIMIVGIILLVVYLITKSQLDNTNQKIIYKYIPRTLKEEEESPIYVSEIFKTMFSQPSTFIDSVNEDTIRRQEALNKYFISLM